MPFTKSDDLSNVLLGGAAASYVITVWLESSLFSRCRGYAEARWPGGPWACQLCLSFHAATAVALYVVLAGDSYWRLPAEILAAAWLTNCLTSLVKVLRART